MGARLVLAATVLVLLAACGDDEPTGSSGTPSGDASSSAGSSDGVASGAGDTPSSPAPSTPSTPAVPADAPACDDVWADGSTLPKGYRGCVADGAYVRAEKLSCSSGQSIIKYDDRFWGVRGGGITEAPDIYESDLYLDAVARCRG